jgi:GNAT superfamily N-acetyltransferase
MPQRTRRRDVPIEELGPDRCDALLRFFDGLPEGDLTFIREEVHDPETVRSWASGPGAGGRWVAVDGPDVTGYVAVRPLPGWSDHVGEVRLVVDPQHRGQGVGRMLARWALLQALDCDLKKLTVEVVAEQEGAVAMFGGLGFQAEGLLRDHVRDRDGELRDLILLSHSVEDAWSAMETAGIDDALA